MNLFKFLKKRKLKVKEKQIKRNYDINRYILNDFKIIKQGGWYVIIRYDNKNNRKFFVGKFKTLLEAMDYFNKIAEKRITNG